MIFFAQGWTDRYTQHTQKDRGTSTTNTHAREPQIRPQQIYLISGDIALLNPCLKATL